MDKKEALERIKKQMEKENFSKKLINNKRSQ